MNTGPGKVAEEITARISLAVQTGGDLAAWRWSPVPVQDVAGWSDFPQIGITDVGQSDNLRPSGLLNQVVTVELNIASRREDGWAAHVENVTKALNTVEKNRATPRAMDTGLAGLLAKPFQVGDSSNTVTNLGIHTKLRLTCELRPAFRAAR